ncbi:hypothetical protein J7J18_06680 [bacterium]|nr:hypothetical protein [bacterium]
MNFKRIARVNEELVQGLENFSLERLFFSVGYSNIVGLYTDGKEAAFGPLVTCGVVIDVHHTPTASKAPSTLRQMVTPIVDTVAGDEINRIGNVDEAIRRSKLRVVEQLVQEYPSLIVVSDPLIPELPADCFPILRGSMYVYVLRLAMILAKELRKEALLSLLNENPGWQVYDLTSNLGFLSKKHREALLEYGRTPQHRYYVKVR